MNKRGSFPAPVGGSSLLVIFAILCMTVFALLTLSTMKADERIADENVKSVTQYYEAEVLAEEIVAKLRQGENVPDVTRNGKIYAFSCQVSDTQILSVVVKIDGKEYQVLSWQEVASEEWNPEEYIKVWGAE